MSRREWAASIGASSAVVAAHWVWTWLATDPLWSALTTAEPRTGRYLTVVLLVPLPLVGAILACAVVNFAEVHGLSLIHI